MGFKCPQNLTSRRNIKKLMFSLKESRFSIITAYFVTYRTKTISGYRIINGGRSMKTSASKMRNDTRSFRTSATEKISF